MFHFHRLFVVDDKEDLLLFHCRHPMMVHQYSTMKHRLMVDYANEGEGNLITFFSIRMIMIMHQSTETDEQESTVCNNRTPERKFSVEISTWKTSVQLILCGLVFLFPH